jgi:5-methylcytosine-specific restriction enzyme B
MAEHRYDILRRAVDRWRDRCLLANGSVFTEESIWTLENVRQLVRYFVENLDMGEGSFLGKLRTQLGPTDPGAKKLAAEMLWVMNLIVHESAMQPATKRLQVEKVWGWSGEEPPDAPFQLEDVMAAGVANPGMAFHSHKWRELAFFVRLMERWKGLPD